MARLIEFFFLQLLEAIFFIMFNLRLLKINKPNNVWIVFNVLLFSGVNNYYYHRDILILRQLLVALLMTLTLTLCFKQRITDTLRTIFLTSILMVFVETILGFFLLIMLNIRLVNARDNLALILTLSIPVRIVEYYILFYRRKKYEKSILKRQCKFFCFIWV